MAKGVWLDPALKWPLRIAVAILVMATTVLAATGNLTPRTPLQDMERVYPVLQGVLNPEPAGTRIRKAPSGRALLSVFAGRWREAAHADLLWDTAPEYADAGHLAAWDAGRFVSFTGLNEPPWAVPERPSWREDPFSSPPWRQAYQSLVWLKAPAYGYATTHQEQYAAAVTSYVMSWVGSASGANGPDAWSDDATVAQRTDTLVTLFENLLVNALTGDDLARFIALLNDHGKWLSSHIGQQVGASAQALDDAVSLFQLSARFPEFAHASAWRTQATQAISRLGAALAAENPLTASASVRELAKTMLADVEPFLAQFGFRLSSADRSSLVLLAQ